MWGWIFDLSPRFSAGLPISKVLPTLVLSKKHGKGTHMDSTLFRRCSALPQISSRKGVSGRIKALKKF